MSATLNIVFDIGNVLVRWDPHAAFRHAFDNEAEIDAALQGFGFFDWNAQQDRGRDRAAAVAAVPVAYAALADDYFERFHLTIRDKITDTWAIMERLRRKGCRIFALTNWSADLWPVAQEVHPQLNEAFEDVVVSGLEGIMKPERAIFDLLCRRNGLRARDCFFIDDSAANVLGARAAGWESHHFTGVEGLRRALRRRELL